MIELCELAGFSIIGIIDPKLQGDYYNYPIIGTDESAPSIFNRYPYANIVLSPDAPLLRKKLSNYYKTIGYKFATIISPDSRISRSAIIKDGAVVQSGVNVSSQTTIGAFVKLNTNCNIMHDVVIEDYSTVAPNAVILGRVSVGESCYIGANSTILPELIIKNNATVGAGAVVTKDVGGGIIVKGVPAK